MIGSWNSTAMFFAALFSSPSLWKSQKDAIVVLPPGGPIHLALQMMHKAKLITRSPEGNELDTEAFEPAALYLNNGLMLELLQGMPGANLADVHGGLYMLGTRRPAKS